MENSAGNVTLSDFQVVSVEMEKSKKSRNDGTTNVASVHTPIMVSNNNFQP